LPIDVGRAGHALDAAGDHQVGLAELHGAGGMARGLEAGAAEAVHGGAGHLDRQAREQAGHAGDVAIVLARLVHAAVDDVVDRTPVDAGVALHKRLDRMGRKVIDAHGAQTAIIAADGGTDRIANEGFGHLGYSQLRQSLLSG
jgi:hypothetical protein